MQARDTLAAQQSIHRVARFAAGLRFFQVANSSDASAFGFQVHCAT